VGGRITHGLIIRAEPLGLILDGAKTWEVRGRRTGLRGPIALIEGGSGTVVGIAELIDVLGPMPASLVAKNSTYTGYRNVPVKYRKYFAWVLRSAERLPRSVPYRHPPGAVVWVRLSETVSSKIAEARATRAGSPRVPSTTKGLRSRP
jgi:hypothetical protein